MDTRTPKSFKSIEFKHPNRPRRMLWRGVVGALAASAATGATRLAKFLVNDKRKGGGLVPRVLPGPGLEFGPDLRAAQFACNIIAGVQTLDKVKRRGL